MHETAAGLWGLCRVVGGYHEVIKLAQPCELCKGKTTAQGKEKPAWGPRLQTQGEPGSQQTREGRRQHRPSTDRPGSQVRRIGDDPWLFRSSLVCVWAGHQPPQLWLPQRSHRRDTTKLGVRGVAGLFSQELYCCGTPS